MKAESIATIRTAASSITLKPVKQWVMPAVLVTMLTTRAGATLMTIGFDDGGNNVGAGVIDVEGGYAVYGDFVVCSGLATGEWTLTGGTPAGVGSGVSPNGYFNYDNMVLLGSDPYLTASGGLLFTNAQGDQLNIWADAPGTYCMWAASSSGSYYVQAGSYPGFSGTTPCGSSTITNAPVAGLAQASPPSLNLQPATNGFTLFWPDTGTVYRLVQNSDLTTTNWVTSTNAVSELNGTNQATISGTSVNLFFRLVNP